MWQDEVIIVLKIKQNSAMVVKTQFFLALFRSHPNSIYNIFHYKFEGWNLHFVLDTKIPQKQYKASVHHEEKESSLGKIEWFKAKENVVIKKAQLIELTLLRWQVLEN